MSIDPRMWIPFLGIAALYIPSYINLYKSVWTNSDEMHGPIMLAVALWALWKVRDKLIALSSRSNFMGGLVLVLGLCFYFVGRTFDIMVLEIGSQILVVGACLLLVGGWPAVRTAVFPLVFMIFIVPLPGTFIDSLTGALKQVVSDIAETILYSVGYPIARSGVVISIGPYQLMVADACSGLKSMFSLSAMGLLYVYLQGHKDWLRNSLLIASLLPIAFAANVVRVIILILVTFHFGDAAGQGFVHDASGLVLFVIAMLFLAGIDAVYGRFLRFKPRPAFAH
jgi:exosortase B